MSPSAVVVRGEVAAAPTVFYASVSVLVSVSLCPLSVVCLSAHVSCVCVPVGVFACHCTVTVTANYKTGIEMEAITGVCAGLLCALDMVKSYEKDNDGQYPDSEISQVKIISKYKSE